MYTYFSYVFVQKDVWYVCVYACWYVGVIVPAVHLPKERSHQLAANAKFWAAISYKKFIVRKKLLTKTNYMVNANQL